MKRVAMLGVVALLLYFPAANADHDPFGTHTGCLDIAGKGKGKISKVTDGSAPLGGACASGFEEIHVGDRLPVSCASGQVAEYDGMSGWVCGTDNDTTGGAQGIMFRGSSNTMGGQAITTGTTQVLINNEQFDAGNDFDTAMLGGVFTAPVTGTYRFEARVNFNGTGDSYASVADGMIDKCKGSSLDTGVGGSVVACLIQLTAGEQILLKATIAGPASTISSGSSQTFFSGSLVS